MLTGTTDDHRVFILNFHGLGKPKRKVAPEDEHYWLEERVFADILDTVRGRKEVRITFDDSNESDYAIALPLLKARKLTARFFILAGYVDEPGFLSRKQIQLLCSEGMAVGSHGMRHRRWTALSEKELLEELVEARDRLEYITGMPMTEAACPFGEYNRRVLQKLRCWGYGRVYTSDGGAAVVNAWLQPRNTVCRHHNLAQVLSLLRTVPATPAGTWRRCKLALKRWR